MMGPQPFRILVVGCGSIGARHARNAAALGETAVFDRDTRRAEDAAAACGARVFTSLDDALAWSPAGVVVATPPASHLAVADAAIVAGAEVLIEKPVSDRPAAAAAFLARAAERERRIFVVCNMRFHPAVVTLRENLPRIGRPHFARAYYGNYLPDMRPGADYRTLYCARRDSGGGVILDGVHEIDYLDWLLGPARLTGAGAARLSDLEIDVEDYAWLTLRHADGVRSEIHLDYLQRAKRRGCEIAGNEGTLVWRSDGKQPEHCTVMMHRPGGAIEELFADQAVDPDAPYKALMTRFAEALAGGRTDLATGQDGRRVLDIADAARRAAGLDTGPRAQAAS